MSLNYHEINVGDKLITLRLTSKALMNFNLKHGAEGNSPVVAVLNAVNDYSARIDLFTNALNHPENRNTVKDGGLLLDLMADSGCWSRETINGLILDLAEESGLLTEDDRQALAAPVSKSNAHLLDALSRLLTGESIPADKADDSAEAEYENPT